MESYGRFEHYLTTLEIKTCLEFWPPLPVSGPLSGGRLEGRLSRRARLPCGTAYPALRRRPAAPRRAAPVSASIGVCRLNCCCCFATRVCMDNAGGACAAGSRSLSDIHYDFHSTAMRCWRCWPAPALPRAAIARYARPEAIIVAWSEVCEAQRGGEDFSSGGPLWIAPRMLMERLELEGRGTVGQKMAKAGACFDLQSR